MLLPFPSLQMLKDLPHRVPVSRELQQTIDRLFAGVPDPKAPNDVMRPFLERALEVADEAVVHLDTEVARLTQRRFSGGDPASLRQRVLGDPKRLADQSINALKQKVSGERSDWQRRLVKQARDVRDGLAKELAGLRVESTPVGRERVVRPAADWAAAHRDWAKRTFDEWTRHLGELLASKYAKLVRPELDAIGQHVDVKLDVQMPPSPPLSFQPRADPAALEVTYAPPTPLEAIFETFKNGLNTVAMMAGLIVVPVVGSLMNESAVVTRAVVMGGLVVPVLVFAVLAGMRARRKLTAAHEERAKQEIAKRLDAAFNDQLERWKSDAERACATYGQQVQDEALAIAEQAVSRQLAKREARLADELASAQVELDRINEQITAIRQAKGGITSQLRLDLVRRLEG